MLSGYIFVVFFLINNDVKCWVTWGAVTSLFSSFSDVNERENIIVLLLFEREKLTVLSEEYSERIKAV